MFGVSEELPALRDGSAWVGGFRNIVDHLSKISDSRWELDHDLDRKDRANVTAYVSQIPLGNSGEKGTTDA